MSAASRCIWSRPASRGRFEPDRVRPAVLYMAHAGDATIPSGSPLRAGAAQAWSRVPAPTRSSPSSRRCPVSAMLALTTTAYAAGSDLGGGRAACRGHRQRPRRDGRLIDPWTSPQRTSRRRLGALLRRPAYPATFAVQIVSVSVGWQVYDITRNPLDLGIVGLVQFLPLTRARSGDRLGRRPVQPTHDPDPVSGGGAGVRNSSAWAHLGRCARGLADLRHSAGARHRSGGMA